MFTAVNARASATGDADGDDKKKNDVSGGVVTSECRRPRKIIYEVLV